MLWQRVRIPLVAHILLFRLVMEEASSRTGFNSRGCAACRIYVSTYNTIANARHAWLEECAVRALRRKLKLSSDSGDSGRKKCKRGYGGAYGGVCQSLCLTGVWSQAVGFVLVHLAGIWLSRCEDVFMFNLHYKEIV
jgi:hypothetical protein